MRAVSNLSRLLALLIVFVLMPGTAEIVENVAHLASDGHTAHAIDDAEHAPSGDEHGCTGTVHVCQCHASVSFLVSRAAFAIPGPQTSDSRLATMVTGHAVAGHSLGVYRPPSA